MTPEIKAFWGLNATPQELLKLYESSNHEKLSEKILEILAFFKTSKLGEVSEEQKNYLNLLVKLILLVVAKENYNIPLAYVTDFIESNEALANLVSITDYETTDTVLKEVINQQNNFFKILFLYSSANAIRLNIEELFAINPYLASLWLSTWFSRGWLASKTAYENMQMVITNSAVWQYYTLTDQRFQISESQCWVGFHSTYVSGTHDRNVKGCINQLLQKEHSRSFPARETHSNKILFISAFLYEGHAVYKCMAQLFYSLKPHYHLTLFHLGKDGNNLDRELFDDIKSLDKAHEAGAFNYDMLEEILKPGFGTIIYPDISLSRASMILSNLRLAPIQITTYGHPVSSFGAEIDYFIAGKDIEPPVAPEKNYSERLVIIPGCGVLSNYPDYQRKYPKKMHHEKIVIGCSWGNIKFNYPHLMLVKKILENSSKKILLHFIGMKLEAFAFARAKKDLSDIFGAENIILSGATNYEKYMELIEGCDFVIDSFHFGSFNRIVDSIACGKLMVCFEGDKAYNRFASTMLEKIGLPELVARSGEEYLQIILKLTLDENYRNSLQECLNKTDVKEKLSGICKKEDFRKAIDYIIANHSALQGDKSNLPVIIDN